MEGAVRGQGYPFSPGQNWSKLERFGGTEGASSTTWQVDDSDLIFSSTHCIWCQTEFFQHEEHISSDKRRYGDLPRGDFPMFCSKTRGSPHRMDRDDPAVELLHWYGFGGCCSHPCPEEYECQWENRDLWLAGFSINWWYPKEDLQFIHVQPEFSRTKTIQRTWGSPMTMRLMESLGIDEMGSTWIKGWSMASKMVGI